MSDQIIAQPEGDDAERFDVLYHPTREFYDQYINIGRTDGWPPMPYSAYPVVSKRGLTLAEAEAFIASNGAHPEHYRTVPAS